MADIVDFNQYKEDRGEEARRAFEAAEKARIQAQESAGELLEDLEARSQGSTPSIEDKRQIRSNPDLPSNVDVAVPRPTTPELPTPQDGEKVKATLTEMLSRGEDFGDIVRLIGHNMEGTKPDEAAEETPLRKAA